MNEIPLPARAGFPTRLGDSTVVSIADNGDVIPEVEYETEQRLDEDGAILAWRMWVLDRAGYGDDAAALLAGCRDVDLHLAADLVERGCPPETALRILL